MTALLDLWYVHLILLVAAGLLITYPQWALAIRRGMKLPLGSTLWGGIVFTVAWKITMSTAAGLCAGAAA